MSGNILKLINTASFFILLFSSVLISQVQEIDGKLFHNFQLNEFSGNAELEKRNSSQFTLADSMNGSVIKKDFMVNSHDGEYGASQGDVSSAMDGSGNYAFAWLDYRNGIKDIYAQFYNSNDEKIGNNFKVNQEAVEGNNQPCIAANSNGDFVIIWLKDFFRIMAQQYSRTGEKVGENIEINTAWGMNTAQPSAAVNDDGSFLVMWGSENGSGIYNVYAILVSSNGVLLTQRIPVNGSEIPLSSIGSRRNVAIDSLGNYYLTWSSYGSNQNSKIYLQKIDYNGQKIDGNILVSSDSDSITAFFPEISAAKGGQVLILWPWQHRYSSAQGTKIRIYDSKNGDFAGEEINVFNSSYLSGSGVISTDNQDIFILMGSMNGKTHLQKIKSTGELLGESVKIDFGLPDTQYYFTESITNIFNGNLFIAIGTYQKRDMDIYKQKINIDLSTIGALNKINDDIGSAFQKASLVKFNSRGESIVLWEDQRNGRRDLYAQVFNQEFQPVGNNFQINDNYDAYFLHDKEIRSLSDGTFVIAFTGKDQYLTGSDVLVQKVSPAGEKIGNVVLIKERNYSANYELAMNVNSQDDILICWYYEYGAFIQKFDKNISPLSSEHNFIKQVYPKLMRSAVSIDTAFNVFTVWQNYNQSAYTAENFLQAFYYDEKNKTNSAVFIIDSVKTLTTNLLCEIDGKNYTVFYRDDGLLKLKRKYFLEKEYSFNNQFYSSLYSPIKTNIVKFNNQKVFVTYNTPYQVMAFYSDDGKRKTESIQLHQYDYIISYSDEFNGVNSADISDGKLFFTYESAINQNTGYDIWAKVLETENIKFQSGPFFPLANSDMLYPNYPNPFNPTTTISYELLAPHNVKLNVYDVLGREVQSLVNEFQEKGVYEVSFDGSNLASGIYFYRLEAFDTSIKKMVLIK